MGGAGKVAGVYQGDSCDSIFGRKESFSGQNGIMLAQFLRFSLFALLFILIIGLKH